MLGISTSWSVAVRLGLLKLLRIEGEGAVWEEEDYCSPPLAEERAAVLDSYFDGIAVEPVAQGQGWRQIEDLPSLFPDLQRNP